MDVQHYANSDSEILFILKHIFKANFDIHIWRGYQEDILVYHGPLRFGTISITMFLESSNP